MDFRGAAKTLIETRVVEIKKNASWLFPQSASPYGMCKLLKFSTQLQLTEQPAALERR